jgi:hypothetical protein
MKAHLKSLKTVSLLTLIFSSYAAHASDIFDGTSVLTTFPPYETNNGPVTAGSLVIGGNAAQELFNSLQRSIGVLPPPVPPTPTNGQAGSSGESVVINSSETRIGQNYTCTLNFTSVACLKPETICPPVPLIPTYSCSITINNLATGGISTPPPVPGPVPTATPLPIIPAPQPSKGIQPENSGVNQRGI